MKTASMYATGRRKESIARVWLFPGTGKITVNEKEVLGYFGRKTLEMILRQPFGVTKTEGQYDIRATVNGGGLTGQAGAMLLGIARALIKPTRISSFSRRRFLTRDPRMKARKK
jgi:small subunit ribosomal protein S9